MIDIIGGRRLFVIFVMVLLNAVLGAGLFYFIMPEKASHARELRQVKADIANLDMDIVNVKQQREKLLEQKDIFEKLKRQGFFTPQNRIVARDRIEEIRELSSVLSARYTIKPALLESNREIKKAGHIILSSPFHIEIEALDDADIFRFIYLLQTSFPGHVSFDDIVIDKTEEVTESVLRNIGSGVPVVLVKADLDFTWRTILPEDQVSTPEGSVNTQRMR
jgi:hypothetical protein